MSLRVQKFLNAHPDTTGDIIGVGIETSDGTKTILEMFMEQANYLIALLARAGLIASEKHNDPDTPPDGVTQLLTQRTTYADASYGPDGQPMLGLYFGRTSLGVRLTTEQARNLADQLQKLSAHTPGGSTKMN